MKLEDIVTKLKSLVDKNTSEISTISTKVSDPDIGRVILKNITSPDDKSFISATDADHLRVGAGIIHNVMYITVSYIWIAFQFRVAPENAISIRSRYGASGWGAWKSL